MRYTDISEARLPRQPTAATLAQASQDGFDTKLWFHGTRRRFEMFRLPVEPGLDELGPGVYLTSQKWLANTWSRDGGFILVCVVRRGPLFDFATDQPRMLDVLRQGYVRYNSARSPTDNPKFDHVWRESRNKPRLINACLAGAGYIGGFKQASQITGQIVVFDPADVRIVARQGGKNHMTSADQ